MHPLFARLQMRTKVLIAATLAIGLGLTVMIWMIASQVYADAERVGKIRAQEQAESYAKQIEAQFSIGFALPQHLADAVTGMQGEHFPPRKTIDQLILKLLGGFPDASGLWMLMEANALDGKDAEYASDWPRHDPTGRYMPYMTRSGDKVAQDVMMGEKQQQEAMPFRSNPAGYKPPYDQAGWGDFYFVPKSRQRDTITEPFPYDVQGKSILMSSLAVVIKNQAGAFQGVAAVDLPLDRLQSIFSQFKPFGVGHLTLVSNGGLYVVHQNSSLLGKPINASLYPTDLLQQMQAGKTLEFERDGALHVWRAITVGNTGQYWGLGVSIPKDVIVADAVNARRDAIIIGLITGVLLLAVLAFMLTILTAPLGRLASAMETLAHGEGDLTRRLEVKSHDEIGRTSEAFNHFMEHLREMFVQVRSESESVGMAARQLSGVADKVAHASQQQAESSTATAASVEQVTVSIQHIAESAHHFETSAASTSRSTEEGQSLVQNVAQEIDKLHQSVDALSGSMGKLNQQSARVDTIVSVIKDIAEQTNLLALNAAIEAARAGEQGRGFAVVADEVRKLAARTSEATQEISHIVGDIQGEISSSDQNMQVTRKQIASCLTISNQASEAIGAVSGETRSLISDVAVIADATREQAAASTDIAKNIEHISNMAQENNHSITEVAHSVTALENLARRMADLVSKFRT
ncbi:methyl-accepting chemotaxis protein [Chitinibacter sp. FCG-7]|uniref:Methyl-accepting chemotaxis protein n=1 Tax=Chitinibacter mangrovi TaxID=3153927 RepID=A0AAU7F406_9NEIS